MGVYDEACIDGKRLMDTVQGVEIHPPIHANMTMGDVGGVEDDDHQLLGFVAIPIVHIVEQICCDCRVAQAQAQAHALIGISIKHAIICSCKSAKKV